MSEEDSLLSIIIRHVPAFPDFPSYYLCVVLSTSFISLTPYLLLLFEELIWFSKIDSRNTVVIGKTKIFERI